MGDSVFFEIGVGKKGDDVAINVVLDPDHESQRITGICTSWNDEKGFGFIERDDDESDVFVHLDHIMDRRELQPNERVEFEVVANPKNGEPMAVRVSGIKESAEIQPKDQMSETSDSDTEECDGWKTLKSDSAKR